MTGSNKQIDSETTLDKKIKLLLDNIEKKASRRDTNQLSKIKTILISIFKELQAHERFKSNYLAFSSVLLNKYFTNVPKLTVASLKQLIDIFFVFHNILIVFYKHSDLPNFSSICTPLLQSIFHIYNTYSKLYESKTTYELIIVYFKSLTSLFSLMMKKNQLTIKLFKGILKENTLLIKLIEMNSFYKLKYTPSYFTSKLIDYYHKLENKETFMDFMESYKLPLKEDNMFNYIGISEMKLLIKANKKKQLLHLLSKTSDHITAEILKENTEVLVYLINHYYNFNTLKNCLSSNKLMENENTDVKDTISIIFNYLYRNEVNYTNTNTSQDKTISTLQSEFNNLLATLHENNNKISLSTSYKKNLNCIKTLNISNLKAYTLSAIKGQYVSNNNEISTTKPISILGMAALFINLLTIGVSKALKQLDFNSLIFFKDLYYTLNSKVIYFKEITNETKIHSLFKILSDFVLKCKKVRLFEENYKELESGGYLNQFVQQLKNLNIENIDTNDLLNATFKTNKTINNSNYNEEITMCFTKDYKDNIIHEHFNKIHSLNSLLNNQTEIPLNPKDSFLLHCIKASVSFDNFANKNVKENRTNKLYNYLINNDEGVFGQHFKTVNDKIKLPITNNITILNIAQSVDCRGLVINTVQISMGKKKTNSNFELKTIKSNKLLNDIVLFKELKEVLVEHLKTLSQNTNFEEQKYNKEFNYKNWNLKREEIQLKFELCLTELNKELGSTMESLKCCNIKTKRVTYFLLISEELSFIPFERLIPKHIQTTRVPSLYYFEILNSNVVYTLPNKIYYNLDPQNNLKNTRDKLLRVFEKFKIRNGITGKELEREKFIELLSDEYFIFYLGHGSKSIPKNKEEFNSVVHFMSCSSAEIDHVSGFLHEPKFYSFLAGSIRTYIGTLWPVTDKEIDKLTGKYFNCLLENKDTNVCDSIKKAIIQSEINTATKNSIVIYGLNSSYKNN